MKRLKHALRGRMVVCRCGIIQLLFSTANSDPLSLRAGTGSVRRVSHLLTNGQNSQKQDPRQSECVPVPCGGIHGDLTKLHFSEPA